jgi:hypothetical protein
MKPVSNEVKAMLERPPDHALALLIAARIALDEMRRTTATDDSFTEAVDRLDAAITAASQKSTLEIDAQDARRYRELRANHHKSDDGDGWLYLSFDCDERYKEMSPDEIAKCIDAKVDEFIAKAKPRS